MSISSLWKNGYRFWLEGLGGRSLEDHRSLLGGLSERNTEFEELDDDSREVLEEQVVVFGVLLDPSLEGLVTDEGQIGGQHHERLSGLVLILLYC